MGRAMLATVDPAALLGVVPDYRPPRAGRRKAEVASYVGERLRCDGVPPSYGMIAEALGMGERADVCRVIARLERDGVLTRQGSGRERRIRMVA